MLAKIKSYLNTKNSYGYSRKDQIIKFIQSTQFSSWKRKINKNSIFNISFIIENSQGDIDIIVVFCILGRSIKIKWYCFVDWWKDNNNAYIVYWKLIGKKYWEK